jgi:hypothetical protein
MTELQAELQVGAGNACIIQMQTVIGRYVKNSKIALDGFF